MNGGKETKKGKSPLGSKSTLGDNHRFPAFYACYLLKSVKTPRSSATYIGSTPHPPRRIRQHNGILSAGAWKTARNRPWEMQMIVHGFASKLAALQFEWAWQHPYLSRFLRCVEGVGSGPGRNRNVRMSANVSVVQAMLRTHPYTTWPLHVKLFTRDAVKCWTAALAAHGADPGMSSKKNTKSKKVEHLPTNMELTQGMPPGMIVTIELEGVDGTGTDDSLKDCDRRKGPIEVTDATFSSAHLSKQTRMLSSGTVQSCSVCGKPIELAKAEPLSTTLCPTLHCTSVAHIGCLSERFLQDARHDELTSSRIIPRGGNCPSCSEYVLWGSIIKGCYRRRMGGITAIAEAEEEEEEIKDDNVAEDDECQTPAREPKKTVGKTKAPRSTTAGTKRGRTKGKARATRNASESGSEQEMFDLNVSGTEDEGISPLQALGRRRPARLQPHHEIARRLGIAASEALR